MDSSDASLAANSAFASTGDPVTSGMLRGIERLHESGVKVSLMCQNRDYACNWIGGELAFLHVE